MAFEAISLSSGMRNSLFSLQKIRQGVDRTQERLSTGKKVNSALDNPTNFFTAASHTNRAIDLAGRKDGIMEGIQTIKAADIGITGISALLDSMRGVAQAALGTTNQAERKSLEASYAEMAKQIDTMASDSSYRGINLLTSQDLIIQFSETSGESTLKVSGTDNTSNGLGVGADTFVSTRGAVGTSTVTITKNGVPVAVPSAPIPFPDPTTLIGTSGSTTYLAYDDYFGSYYYWSFDAASGASSWTDLADVPPSGVSFGSAPVTTMVPKQPWTSDAIIKAAESSVNNALSTLRNRSEVLSNNLNIATTRLDFISDMSGILQTGAENLTLADMDEEAANMLSLQTRQDLGVSSLQMAGQSSQSVLQLF
jgi:flagellin-like hook-associated protein FlgL